MSHRVFGPRGDDEYTDEDLRTIPISSLEESLIWQNLHRESRYWYGYVDSTKLDPKTVQFWVQYKKDQNPPRSAAMLFEHYLLSMMPNLPEADLLLDQKLELSYRLGIPLHKTILEQTLPLAKIELDSLGRIVYLEKYGDADYCLGMNWREVKTEPIDDYDYKKMSYKSSSFSKPEQPNQQGSSDEPGPSDQLGLFNQKGPSDQQGSSNQPGPSNQPSPTSTNTYRAVVRKSPVEKQDVAKKQDNPQFSPSEEHKMWLFLYDEIQEPKTGVLRKVNLVKPANKLWQRLAKCTDPTKTAVQCYSWLHTKMVHSLPNAHLTLRTKLELLYCLNIPVEQTLYKKLQSIAVVDLSADRCIKHYQTRLNTGKTSEPNRAVNDDSDEGNEGSSSKPRDDSPGHSESPQPGPSH